MMQTKEFLTVSQIISSEIEEKRSRFIATLVPFSQFDETLAELRKEHRKANHHVTAFRYMDPDDRIIELGKDDGEPSGTSGMPVLKTLIGAGLMDVAMIVTRYFGGTKLGTGGLARAYSGASNATIEIADKIKWQQIEQFETRATFSKASEIEALILKTGVLVLDRVFDADGIRFVLKGPREAASLFRLSE